MIQNLRDVGESVNTLLNNQFMNEGMLFRGGTVSELLDHQELPSVNTIVNFQRGPDRDFGLRAIHLPANDSRDNYRTENDVVRQWLNRSIRAVFMGAKFPVLVHCTAGKDRTGVFIALVLLCIGVDEGIVCEEYALSDGIADVGLMQEAIRGIGDPRSYLFEPMLIDEMKRALVAGK